MKRRFWILPISAVLILAACVYKLTRDYDAVSVEVPERRCPAGDFTFSLPHQHRPIHYVNLRGFLGRHRIVLVFYDGEQGADANPVLRQLREVHKRLERKNVEVLGISTATPQENRPSPPGSPYRTPNQPQEPFPFPLLSDLAPHPVHKQWGRFDAGRNEPTSGVFFIDRAGYVRCDGENPMPLPHPTAFIDELLRK